MASKSWSLFVNRSMKYAREQAFGMARMSGVEPPSRAPKTLFTMNTPEDIGDYYIMSDKDIGGSSTVNFDLDKDPQRAEENGGRWSAKFWGVLSTKVPEGMEGKMRSGYVGFRNNHRPTLFGDILDDVHAHRYLALRVRAAGTPRLRNSYFVNIQTDDWFATDLWQHRLYFSRTDGGWEDVFIPFDNFLLTQGGVLQEAREMDMNKWKIKSVGISLLGGHSGIDGSYELGIDSIRAVNEEDVTAPLAKGPALD
ncbi:complex I intermediate-associated protein CIA30 [Punctularia strigosozonata HHB-11173 SS5]|uniref:complex I intermediate-associated protein CIA30 n=1 Tax=Punctularia strigosozonata (strain HHB-11173) TaxID=741275 RepID=UPI0004418503|nr:complex I intermediate-associated protein CIA30 [Punctularia strigosozonata HHB-11173 SS5]EIN09841.1 complex I intermediate-associated protein CIA30 [Punctularia strigosozonata HHB-11173 SS5]